MGKAKGSPNQRFVLLRKFLMVVSNNTDLFGVVCLPDGPPKVSMEGPPGWLLPRVKKVEFAVSEGGLSGGMS